VIPTRVEIKIEEEMAKLARAAMEQPSSDLFTHGKSVGVYQGLKRALQIVLDTRKDAEDKQNEL
jgi:hypothetical protein